MKRLAVFAGYNKEGFIAPYVVYYLEELSKVADIVIVYDNAISEKELSKIKHLSIHQICEKHGEYDFGSYKRGYLWAKESGILNDYDSLTFCNDSVYGPFRPLKPIYEEFEKKNNSDFWGVFLFGGKERFPKNSAFYKTEHLQSYFMVFSPQVFNSIVFKVLISSVRKQINKKEIVRKYEAGMYQLLTANGFSCSAMFESYDNDPHGSYAIKLIDNGFPFLKKCLFDINREDTKCRELINYRKSIARLNSEYPISYINQDLKKTFNKKDVLLVLNRKIDNFNIFILHYKLIRLKGRYVKRYNFKFMVDLFGITILSVIIPRSIVEKLSGIEKYNAEVFPEQE